MANGHGGKRTRHSDETRAAVTAALLAGQGIREVAEKYKVDRSLVSRWRGKIPTEQLNEVALAKKERLIDLIEAHLRQSLIAATTLAHKATNNDKWFSEQSASDIAILYGVLTDKVVRLLEASQHAFSSPQQPDAGDGLS